MSLRDSKDFSIESEIILQAPFTSLCAPPRGSLITSSIRPKLIKFSAISIYIGMAIFFFAVLLNDVKLTSSVFINAFNIENFFDKNNVVPLVTVTGTIFAYFSIIILSFGDFSRYVKNENELKINKKVPARYWSFKNLFRILWKKVKRN